EEPLWHLDTVLSPAALRRAKARRYERERPGMRLAGLAHNTGLYVPELYEGLELKDVPPGDDAAIGAALDGGVRDGLERKTLLVRASEADVDGHWVGAPFGDCFYRTELRVVSEARVF